MGNTIINELAHKIIDCAINVHSTIGNGFQKVVYQRALAIEMEFQKLSFKPDEEMPIFYKEAQIGTERVDFFVEQKLLVELKVIEKLTDVHESQTIKYLETFNIGEGLLINFGGKSLDFKIVYNKYA
jgi:GxxExxY protein